MPGNSLCPGLSSWWNNGCKPDCHCDCLWGQIIWGISHTSQFCVFLRCYRGVEFWGSNSQYVCFASLPEWLRLPQYTSWSLLAGSDQEQRQPQPMTAVKAMWRERVRLQTSRLPHGTPTCSLNMELWGAWERERALSLRMFSRDILSDDGGFTVKHHQQTFVWQKQQETIVLSYVGVSSAVSQCVEWGAWLSACSPGLGEEPTPSLLYP